MINWKRRFLDVYSERWYLARYPDVAAAVERGDFSSGKSHFRKRGRGENRSPGPAFDTAFYLSELGAAKIELPFDPISHYFTTEEGRGISPHWLFDEDYYRHRYPDVDEAVTKSAFRSGYHHYVTHVPSELHRRGHPLFSAYIYASQSDLRVGENPFFHFLQGDGGDRIVPTPIFDLEWYLNRSTHAGAGQIPGQASLCAALLGEFIKSEYPDQSAPCPDFDPVHYARANPDVAKANLADTSITLFKHWVYFGIREGRDPNRFFDSEYYLSRNRVAEREIKQWGLLGAFEHFLFVGKSRGYKCSSPQVNFYVDEEQSKTVFIRKAYEAANLLSLRAPVALPDPGGNPELSLVIPVLDNFEFTAQLLLQLSAEAPAQTEVIVVDNGSSDRTRVLESYFSNLVYIRNEKNLGFPAACNQGWKSARAPVVVLMNNDVLLGVDALNQLRQVFGSEDNVGAVGARIIRSHGLLQEAGSIIWRDGSTQGYGRDYPSYHSNAMKRRAVDYCSACFLAVSKNALEELGGLSEEYSPGYYEEVDLCAQIWSTGRRVLYEPQVSVTHFEYGSFSKGRPPTASHNLMREKRKVFRKRQAKFLEAQPSANTVDPVFLIDREKRGKKRLLIVDDYPPIPQLGSGFVRTQNLIEEFSRLDIDIVLISFLRPETPDYSLIRKFLPSCDLIFHDELDGGLKNFIQRHAKYLSGIWISRTHNLTRFKEDLGAVKSIFPAIPLILDTEALSTFRLLARADLDPSRVPGSEHYEVNLQRELSGLELFDLVISVNDFEHEKIKELPPEVDSMVIGHRRKSPVRLPEFDATEDFLFVGAIHAADTPNFDSLVWFIRNSWPLVRERLGAVKLHVVGFSSPEVEFPKEVRAADGVVWHGPVDSLDEWYGKSRVLIAPTRFAAGIPFKVHEAVSMGVPAVITDLLAQQLGWTEGDGVSVAQVSDSDAFADACIALYLDKDLWSRLQDIGQTVMDRDAGVKEFAARVREVAKRVNLKKYRGSQ